RADDDRIQTWHDLRRPPGKRRMRVGVLAASAAQRYIRQKFGDDVELLAYSEGVTSAMRLVENGQLDATVQDLPAATFYAKDFPRLHFVGEPTAPGYYVIFVRRQDTRLREQINAALRTAIH